MVDGLLVSILQPSLCPVCHVTLMFPFTRGRIYFFAPLILGLATWFDLGLAIWLALAIRMLAGLTWAEAWHMLWWLSLFTRNPTFYHENNMLQKAAEPKRMRHVKDSWTQPAAWSEVQLSPTSISWTPADLQMQEGQINAYDCMPLSLCNIIVAIANW